MALREHIDRALRAGATRLDGDGARLLGGHRSWTRRSVLTSQPRRRRKAVPCLERILDALGSCSAHPVRFASGLLNLLQNHGERKDVHHLVVVAVNVHERDTHGLLR